MQKKGRGNCIADLSHLGGLNPIDTLDLENTYPATKESTFSLPPKGIYSVRAPETFPQAAFSRTKAGALQIQIDPTIVGPSHEGFVVRFVKISAKTFDRKGTKASQVGDYLAACGWRGVLRTEADIANAVEETANVVYETSLDWRAYNKRTGWSLEGMERFPQNEDGTYRSWVIDPSEVGKTDENGRQLVVFANVYIPFGGFVIK